MSTRAIWRTVVVAGAMIGSPLELAAQPAPSKDTPTDGKGGAPAKDAPAPAKDTAPAKDAPTGPTTPTKNKPVDKRDGAGSGAGSGSGSGARPRKADNERPTGRGFVLS